MINAGSWKDKTWPDDWTSVTVDGKRSAQFEHTVLVTEKGYEILTARTKESPPLWWEVAANGAIKIPWTTAVGREELFDRAQYWHTFDHSTSQAGSIIHKTEDIPRPGKRLQ